MNEPGFTPPGRLAGARVAIAGLGLMGGSLAMALRGKCREILGVDPDPAVLALAQQKRLADRLAQRPEELFPQADIIILAAPVCVIVQLLQNLPRLHPGNPVVMDLGSTKRDIMAAMQLLPERFDPLGGHPMCGKEKSSLAEADPCIYTAAAFALVPLERTSARARALAAEIVTAAAARPLWLAADVHDRWTAATSHLPYLLANALAAATPLEAAPMVGSGFRSTARVAATPPSVMLDVLNTNRENVLAALSGFRSRLDELENLLRGDSPALGPTLTRGADCYHALIGESHPG